MSLNLYGGKGQGICRLIDDISRTEIENIK